MQQQQIREIRDALAAFFSDAFGKKPTDDQTDVQCLFEAADAQAGTLNFKVFVNFQPDESHFISVKSLNKLLRDWPDADCTGLHLLSPTIEEEPFLTTTGAGSEIQFFVHIYPLDESAARWIVPAEDWKAGSLELGDKLTPGNDD